ncbi:MAG: hypothetical protein ACO1RA_08500 [Planctomycetaceae bacterium]
MSTTHTLARHALQIRLILASLAAVFLLTLAFPSTSQAYYPRRRRGPSPTAMAYKRSMVMAAQSQIAAGKQVLEAAESKGADAERRLSTAVNKLKTASEEMKVAKSNTRELEKQLREVEKEILAAEPEDSDYGVARAALDADKKKLAELEKSLLSDPDVAEKLRHLTGSELTAAKAKVYEGSSEHTLAKTTVSASARRLDQVIATTLAEHEDWKHISEALADAHNEESQVTNRTISSGASKLSPSLDLRKAENAAAAAKNAIAQGEAVLRRFNVGNNNNKNNNSKNSSASKSNNGKK